MFDSLDLSGNSDQLNSNTSVQVLDVNSYNLLPGTAYGLPAPLQNGSSSLSFTALQPIDAGIFTVGEAGIVGFNYLFDGGGSQGELAIFSLTGMEEYGVGSNSYIQEAARRAAQNSPNSGYVVIRDRTEGAKYSDRTEYEGGFNTGSYLGTKIFELPPGTKFGIMLVPNGTVTDVINSPDFSGNERPVFSIPTANLNETIQFAQVPRPNNNNQSPTTGNIFGFDDLQPYKGSDLDYNDLVFQLTGVTGGAPSLDTVIDPTRDWRLSQVGQEIISNFQQPSSMLAKTQQGKASWRLYSQLSSIAGKRIV